MKREEYHAERVRKTTGRHFDAVERRLASWQCKIYDQTPGSTDIANRKPEHVFIENERAVKCR